MAVLSSRRCCMSYRRSRIEQAVEAWTGSRTESCTELSDEQWFLIADLFPLPPPSPRGGCPPIPARPCVEGILWVLRSGARWKDLPNHFPSPSTCWRRHRDWTEAGLWEQAQARLLRMLDRQGRVETEESLADGTFASAKKGARASARPNVARAPRLWCSPKHTVCRWRPTSPAPVRMK